MKKIEWFDESGTMGGQRGLGINLKDKTLYYWNGEVSQINELNIEDAVWVIQKNLENLKEMYHNLLHKFHQTEPIRTYINGGCSISSPLTEQQKMLVLKKMERIERKVGKIYLINAEELKTSQK